MPQTVTAQEFFGTTQNNTVSAEEFFKKDNFFERFGDDLKERFGEQGAEIINARVRGDQGFASTALQLTGKVGAGTIMDFIGEALISGGRGLSAITPDFIEDPLKENATKAGILLLDTELGQKGLEAATKGVAKWEEFSSEHPVMARNIESVVNIGLLVAPVKGKPKPVRPGRISEAGRAVGRSGRRAAVSNRRAFMRSWSRPSKQQRSGESRLPEQQSAAFSKRRKLP